MVSLIIASLLFPSRNQNNQPADQKTRIMDWIRIEENQFINESGRALVFHGVHNWDPYNLEQEGHRKEKREADRESSLSS